jgi:uncharacterized protein (TIGR03089 family)
MSKYFQSLQLAVKERGPSPLVTWVSAVGRVELSAVTFANAVSKASNFLIDGLELDETSSIAVDLGNHWQSPVWLGTGLATGIKITDSRAGITFGTLAAARLWPGNTDEFVVISQDPFGMPDKDIPAGFTNGSAEVRNFGDYFAASGTVGQQEPVLLSTDKEFTWDQLVAHSLELAKQYEIEPGQNYGLKGDFDLLSKTALQVILPSINKNSVVLIDQVNPDLDAIMKQEKLAQIVTLS